MSVEKLNSPPIGRAYDKWLRNKENKLIEYNSYNQWLEDQKKSKKGEI